MLFPLFLYYWLSTGDGGYTEQLAQIPAIKLVFYMLNGQTWISRAFLIGLGIFVAEQLGRLLA